MYLSTTPKFSPWLALCSLVSESTTKLAPSFFANRALTNPMIPPPITKTYFFRISTLVI